jgi:hypothetical protein
MHRLIRQFLVVALIALQGCMLPGRLTRLVATTLPKPPLDAPPELPARVTVVTDSIRGPYMGVNTKLKQFFAVPLLVYTYSREKMECVISAKRYTTVLRTQFASLCASESYREKLKDLECRITVKQVPAKLFHVYNGHFVALPLVRFSVHDELMYYPAGEIVIEYTLTRDATPEVVRRGELRYPLYEMKFNRDMWHTRRELVASFTNALNDYLTIRCEQAAQSVLDQIASL